MKKAVVLLSGGLDSATTLYFARKQGYKCFCLIFDYGQRHKKEIESAKKIAREAVCPAQVIKINLPWGGSSLLDKELKIPQRYNVKSNSAIPSTYVPARNIIFLSFALSFAEAIKAEAIFIGAHIQDYSGYPDCRPEFYRAFKKVILTGTKAGVEKRGIKIQIPLIRKTKAQIIRKARQLNVPLALTWSCYRGGKVPCSECDSCYYRAKGFREAGIRDPLTKGRLLTQSRDVFEVNRKGVP
ncbi:MAG: 7-cyano-7-deazaguanine synthase QueC [Candidatus Omnitrophota bacterium]|nr:7-cyano-7-deazaguanine synthase QueC [Candidatus Omnitrophota bacterium]